MNIWNYENVSICFKSIVTFRIKTLQQNKCFHLQDINSTSTIMKNSRPLEPPVLVQPHLCLVGWVWHNVRRGYSPGLVRVAVKAWGIPLFYRIWCTQSPNFRAIAVHKVKKQKQKKQKHKETKNDKHGAWFIQKYQDEVPWRDNQRASFLLFDMFRAGRLRLANNAAHLK